MRDFITNRAGRCLPPRLVQALKRAGVHLRYLSQSRSCHQGVVRVGSNYPQKVIFIAGLPKSGTTWLKKMLTSYPGFHELLIPDVTAYELASGGSHDYDLPADMFSRFSKMLVVTKMHVHGSPHNVELTWLSNTSFKRLAQDPILMSDNLKKI